MSLKAYLTQFIGTFFLVLTIGLVVTAGAQLAPLAIGGVLMVMVYMGGPISGGHYNPAVSLAVLMRGKLSARDFIPYLIAQFAGAIAAASMVYALTGKTFAPEPAVSAGMIGPLLAEFLFTFALALVVLNVATAPEAAGNSYFGLAIGFTVMVGAISVGRLSGGAFNPAVGTGPALVRAWLDGASLHDVWLYLAGPFLGGAFAARIYAFQHPDGDKAQS